MSILPHQLGEGMAPKELRYSVTDPLAEMGAPGATGLIRDLMLYAHEHGVEALFEHMTNMPWAIHHAPAALRILAEHLERRAEREIGEGEDPMEVTREGALNAASEFHDAESFSPFPRGALAVVDLNRSSAFFHAVTDAHRARLDEALQTVFGQLMRETGVSLVQKPAGDQYAFFVEYDQDEKDNTARLQAFMRRLGEIRIPTGLQGRDYERMGLNPAHYPNDQFTMATGVHECEAGDLQTAVFMGSKESTGGYTAILGKGMAAGIELQKKAGPGQILFCSRSEARMREAGDSSHVIVPRPRPPMISLLNLQPGPMQAQLLTLFRTLHHPSSLEKDPKKLGTTYVCLKVGDAQTVADYKAYAAVAKAVFSVLEKPQFRGFTISKQDFTMLHFEVDERHREDQELVMQFCNELLSSLELAGVSAGAGIAHADAMLTTRYRNSLALDRSSSAIVEAVRCAALAPKGQIACGRSALAVWGERVEYDVIHLKEGPLFHAVNEGLGSTSLKSKALEGVEEVLAELRAFCFSTPAVPEVVYALGAQEALQGKGPGISALLRQLTREVPEGFQLSRIPNEGNGGYGYIRGVLQAMGLPTDGDDETVMANFSRLLLEADWSTPRVLMLDAPQLSPEEEDAFSRLTARLAGTPTKLLCTSGPHVNGFKAAAPSLVKQKLLQELTPESACRLLMSARPDLKADDHDVLLAALVKVRGEHDDLPFTPRHVLHVYASALHQAGAELLFDARQLKSVRAGDLGVALREDGISSTGRRILGVLAHSRRSQWNLNGFYTFYGQATGDQLTLDDFEKELAVLRKKYLREEPILIALKARYAVPAMELYMPEDAQGFSKTLLDGAGFKKEEAPSDEEEAFSEWTHLFKTLAGPNDRLRELTRFLAQSYLNRGLRNEARRIYADYFHKGLVLTGPDTDLMLDAVWLFADGEDPVHWDHAKELAGPLLVNEYLTASLRLELVWRLYRISVKENSNHNDPEVLLAELAKIAELHGQAFVSLPAREGEKELRDQVLNALRSSSTFYTLKVHPPKDREPGAEQALKEELARDQRVVEPLPGGTSPLLREVWASQQRLLAGRYKLTHGGNDPIAHTEAKRLFASATAAFEGLDGTLREDPRQKRDCRVFGNEADMYLVNIELGTLMTAESERKQAARGPLLNRLGDTQSGMFKDGLEVYRECCLKGDRLNRRAASAHLGNLLILEARARGLDPQPGDEERILGLIPEVRKYWAHYPSAAVEAEIQKHVPSELYSRVAM